jgi:hypothetical protein
MLSRGALHIAALGLLAACGPNYRYVYDGESAFERCYANDFDAAVAPAVRSRCWQEWLQAYSYGGAADRVEFARGRLTALETQSAAPAPPAPAAPAAPGPVASAPPQAMAAPPTAAPPAPPPTSPAPRGGRALACGASLPALHGACADAERAAGRSAGRRVRQRVPRGLAARRGALRPARRRVCRAERRGLSRLHARLLLTGRHLRCRLSRRRGRRRPRAPG